MTKLTKVGIVGFIAIVGGAAIAGDWSSAKSKADDFKSKADQLVRDLPSEAKQIVSAACSATDDERGRAAESAASNARGHINDKYNDLERTERDAIDKLEHVDDKDHKDEARRLADDVKSRWSKIGDQTHDLRNGASHIVDYMKGGERALRDHSPHCDAKDISMDAGHAMCIVANGDTCKIVEYSSDGSNAVGKARDRASRYKSQLEREIDRKEKGEGSDLMKRLISNHSDFAKCKRVETRVDCYKQCPDVDSDGKLRESSPSWREGC